MEKPADTQRRTRRLEVTLVIVVWLVVFAYPLLTMSGRAIDDDGGTAFEWEYVFTSWGKILPFFVVFLLNQFVLIPRLFQRGRTRAYVLAVAVTTIAFFFCAQALDRPRREAMQRHTEWVKQKEAKRAAEGGNTNRDNNNKNKRFRRMPPPGGYWGVAVMETLMAVMLMGCGLAAQLCINQYVSKKRIEELEKYRLRQELARLKAQISPHFFMNMLNNIHGMVEIDPEKAQEMIIEMSNLLRYVTYEASKADIALEKELRFIEDYISLMRSRMPAEKVTITTSFPDNTTGVKVPTMIFITFIENVFKHGISYRHHTDIDIEIHLHDERLSFACTNTLPAPEGEHENAAGKGGVGLRNVRHRLELLYGNDFLLTTGPAEGKYQVMLNIPLK